MDKINMRDYRVSVRKNKSYFNSLDKRLAILSKRISKISKEHNGNRVLKMDVGYGDEWLSDMFDEVIDQRPANIGLDEVMWFIYFDRLVSKKIAKYEWDSYFKELLRRIRYGNDKQKFFSVSAGLFAENTSRGKRALMFEEPRTTSRYQNTVTPEEILRDKELNLGVYQEGLGYLQDNIDIFPTSVAKELKRVLAIKEEVITQLLNGFQYKIYIMNMKSKPTEKYLRDELRRLRVKTSDSIESMKTSLLVIKAFVEKYGSEKMLSKDYFLRVVSSNIIQKNIGGEFTKEDLKTLMTPEVLMVINYSTLKQMGLKNNQISELY